MQSTPIKINTASNGHIASPNNAVKLNNALAKKPESKAAKFLLWFLLLLAIVEGAALAWLYSIKPVSPLSKLISQDAIASAYINQTALLEFFKSLKANNADWPPFNYIDEASRRLISQIGQEQAGQISQILDSEIALILLPPNNGQEPAWLGLATLKISNSAFQKTERQFKEKLKQNYNLVDASYRQINITAIQTINQKDKKLLYAQTKRYFVLSNNEEILRRTLDKIIEPSLFPMP